MYHVRANDVEGAFMVSDGGCIETTSSDEVAILLLMYQRRRLSKAQLFRSVDSIA